MDDYILTLHGLVAEVAETDGEVIPDEELAAMTPTEAHELAGLLRDRPARMAFFRRYISACPADCVLPALHPLDVHNLPAFAECLLRRATEDAGIVALLVGALVRGTVAPTLTQWMMVSASVASLIVDTAALTSVAAAKEAQPWVLDILAIHGEALQLVNAFRLLSPLQPGAFRRVTCSGDTDLVEAVRCSTATAAQGAWTLVPQYDSAQLWSTSLVGRTAAAFTIYAPTGTFLYIDRIHLYGSANKTDWRAEAVYDAPPVDATVEAAASPIDLSVASPSSSSDSGYASDVSLQESYTVLDLLRQNRRQHEEAIILESRVQQYAQRNTLTVIRLDPTHMHTGVRVICEYEYVSRIELYGEAIVLC